MRNIHADRSERPSDAELDEVKRLLLSKRRDSIAFALSRLESLGTTRADYAWIFDRQVIKALLQTWDETIWEAASRAILPHEVLFDTFRQLAEKAYAWHQKKTGDRFNGLSLALIPAARLSFLATWGPRVDPRKPFIDLVQIPVGSFIMGSPKNEADRGDDENQVAVRITKSFAMGRTVVTRWQWRAVMGTEPWRYPGMAQEQCDADFPAVKVSWDDAVLFCQTLTGLEQETGRLTTKQSYRLPTEAEWEYACRAGTTTAYSFGDDPAELGDCGWYDRNSGMTLHSVGVKKPNPWGLFDMHGNVCEWCADWYAATLTGGDDPVGPPIGTRRVRRGGYYHIKDSGCRSAFRGLGGQRAHYEYGGFRVTLVSSG